MTMHELKYCRFLLQCVKDLYIERSAMSTILDTPSLCVKTDWRSATAEMSADAVFGSAIKANFAPVFEKLESAINNEQLLTTLLAKCKTSA
jgi:hypothetical protein